MRPHHPSACLPGAHLLPVFALFFPAFIPTALPAIAQEAPGATYVETVEVELVNVEVRVVDGSGRPVGGLTADDFEVVHDGEEVAISNFTEFRDGLAATAPGGAAPAAEHHLIVYLDELHLQAAHRAPLLDALEELIAGELIQAERIMIMRQGRELSIEAPFGTSRSDLRRTLTRLGTSPPGFSAETETRQALDEIQRAWNQSRDATGSGETGMPEIPGDIFGEARAGDTSPRDVVGSSGNRSAGVISSSCDIFESRVEAILAGWMQRRQQQIAVTLASLGDSASYLAALPGNKSLLYLSDALETRPGQALSSYADTICPGGTQNLAIKKLGEQLDAAFLDLTRHAAANRVTFYALQGGGLQSGTAAGARNRGVRAGSIASFDASRRASDQSGLIVLAEETGGRALLSQNDYVGALESLGAEMLSFYSLAYRPPPSEGRLEHRIVVNVRDGSLTARHRRGYKDKSADERFTEKLQGALYLGLVDNPLEARLAASGVRAGGMGAMILPLRVVLPVDLVSFDLQGEQLRASVLVRVLSRNLESGQIRVTDRSFQVKHQAEGGGEWIQLPVDLEVPPGSYVLAVGVLDQESGMTSLVSTMIDVPSS